ncbi:MAG: phosphate ABC transporter permease PstA [Syntrophomonadaceae bacterium]|nr:phosphate ABC transporter permease PstA [Syntrophomonadaceae bacterium]
MNRRRLVDYVQLGFYWLSGLSVLLVLLAIIAYLVWRGGPQINLEFLLERPRGTPLGSAGGIFPAIKGTLWLVFWALFFSVPSGLVTAVFLSEYGSRWRIAGLLNLMIQSMAGIPSIITGLFAYALGVVQLGWGISLLAGGLALGIMIFPVIAVSTRDALQAVDNNYRLLACSLGVSELYALRRIILPRAMPGILAGILLATGYAAGATAPIMVTAAAIISSSSGAIFEPVMALPYHLYILFNEHISMDNAYATALILVVILLIINMMVLWLRSWQERIKQK